MNLDDYIEERRSRSPRFAQALADRDARNDLIAALRQIRLEQRKTQADVAADMECSLRHVQALEAGVVDPKLSTLHAYAHAVDHTIRTRLWPKAD